MASSSSSTRSRDSQVDFQRLLRRSEALLNQGENPTVCLQVIQDVLAEYSRSMPDDVRASLESMKRKIVGIAPDVVFAGKKTVMSEHLELFKAVAPHLFAGVSSYYSVIGPRSLPPGDDAGKRSAAAAVEDLSSSLSASLSPSPSLSTSAVSTATVANTNRSSRMAAARCALSPEDAASPAQRRGILFRQPQSQDIPYDGRVTSAVASPSHGRGILETAQHMPSFSSSSVDTDVAQLEAKEFERRKDELLAEIRNLSSKLLKTNRTVSEHLQRDNSLLSEAEKLTEKNVKRTTRENAELKKVVRRGCSDLCVNLGLLAMVFVLFFATFMLMRVFPKR